MRNVQSALSKDHERLGNSSVFIVPPPGFASIKGLNGIMKESVNASIIVLELTGQFESTARLFGAQAMRKKTLQSNTKKKSNSMDIRDFMLRLSNLLPMVNMPKWCLPLVLILPP
ncbi:MAG: hypothetical protein IPP37_00035 [Saprospiraceae bacterium]|nr:hypothetical protein [Saprospiraceae bacterium]